MVTFTDTESHKLLMIYFVLDLHLNLSANEIMFNPFLANALILYPLKILENLWFSGVFRRYKIGILDRNG